MPISGTMNTDPSLAFVGCEISAGDSSGLGGGGSSHSHTQGRREVVVSGKRVKTIDVHAHCIVPEAAKLMGNPNTSVADVCKTFNVSKATLYRHVPANGSG